MNFRVPFAFASVPVPFTTSALPETLNTCPASSPHAVEPATTLKVSLFLPVPVITPGPVNGTHGCWELSPVPVPVIFPAPSFVPLPVPDAVMLATLSLTVVVAVPE